MALPGEDGGEKTVQVFGEKTMYMFQCIQAVQGVDPGAKIPRHEKSRSGIDRENAVKAEPVGQRLKKIRKCDRSRSALNQSRRIFFDFQDDVAMFEHGKMAVRFEHEHKLFGGIFRYLVFGLVGRSAAQFD